MAVATPIGLDIGSMSIRAVETSRAKDGPVITNFGVVPLPPGAVHSGVVHDGEAVTAALKQLWEETKFRSRNVILGVTNPQIVVREMSLLNVPGPELRRSLPFQVRDALALPVEKLLLDFFPLQDPGEAENVRGLLIAAPKDAVLAAVHAVERAGLHVAQVDLASFALLRAASRLDGQVEALVDIGGQATTVIVHIGGEPLIVRTVPRGGAEITELIAKRLTIDLWEAEELKCRVGLRADSRADVAEAVAEAIRPLIGEIRSSFAYLTAGERQTRVRRIAVSGGGALLPGLLAELAVALDVDVVLADPMARLRDRLRGRHSRGKHDSLEHLLSSAAVSIGLTLGAA